MRPQRFVTELASFAKSVDHYVAAGFSTTEAMDHIRSYHCEQRSQPLTSLPRTDSLIELLVNWDLQHVEIGMVSFLKQPLDTEYKITIGAVEADPLVIRRDTGEIVVFEYGIENHIIWQCAQDGDSFLEAMLPASKYLSNRTVADLEDPQEPTKAKKWAAECITHAGGSEYEDFYWMLLGAEEY